MLTMSDNHQIIRLPHTHPKFPTTRTRQDDVSIDLSLVGRDANCNSLVTSKKGLILIISLHAITISLLATGLYFASRPWLNDPKDSIDRIQNDSKAPFLNARAQAQIDLDHTGINPINIQESDPESILNSILHFSTHPATPRNLRIPHNHPVNSDPDTDSNKDIDVETTIKDDANATVNGNINSDMNLDHDETSYQEKLDDHITIKTEKFHPNKKEKQQTDEERKRYIIDLMQRIIDWINTKIPDSHFKEKSSNESDRHERSKRKKHTSKMTTYTTNNYINQSPPDINQPSPDVQKSSPDVQKSLPDVQKSLPDVQKSLPDVQKSLPDVQKSSPDVNQSQQNDNFITNHVVTLNHFGISPHTPSPLNILNEKNEYLHNGAYQTTQDNNNKKSNIVNDTSNDQLDVITSQNSELSNDYLLSGILS